MRVLVWNFLLGMGILFSLFDLLVLVLFLNQYQKSNYRLASLFVLLKIATSFIYIVMAFNLFGGAFGPGVFMILGSPVAGVILGVYFLFRIKLSFGLPVREKALFWIGGAFIILMQFTPNIAYLPIKYACMDWEKSQLLPLQQAIAVYRETNGYYPKELSDLAPIYISKIPRPVCSFLSFGYDYVYKNCDGTSPYVITPTCDRVGFVIHDLKSGEQSLIWSFLDYPDPYSCR